MNIYKNKKVFLTGHTGFKGSWLNLWLKNLGAEVFGYSLAPITNPNHFDLLGGKSAFDGIFADIRDRETLQSKLIDFNPDIIFHLAAQPLVRESYKDPLGTFSSNAIGTLNILESARNIKNLKAIVVITTDKVYENKEWIYGYRENDPLGGYDPYSASKACAEIITDSMRKSFFNTYDFGKTHNVLIATARAGNVIGGGDFSIDRLIPDLIKGILNNKTTEIRNPNATRPWQSVLEPLRGYLMLGEKLLLGESEFATSFNFGPNIDGNLKVSSMLNIAKNSWDKISYTIQCDKSNPHEANLLMLDTAKAHHLLSWKPILDTRESIENTIIWYRNFIENNAIISQNQLENYLQHTQKSSMGGDSKLGENPRIYFGFYSALNLKIYSNFHNFKSNLTILKAHIFYSNINAKFIDSRFLEFYKYTNHIKISTPITKTPSKIPKNISLNRPKCVA
ncbi:CDP-glucose 4,6-dehydratase [Helicobacter sp. 16-1353]|nr:CDP-glucose 4,6-dehydratase [Helicobacter sp. 16-1353]